MRTTHRRTWRREEWLIVDERTGATHYASEMVREPDTGLLVHRDSVDPKHPQLKLRPKYRDPAPVTPVVPAPLLIPPGQVNFADDLSGLIGQSGRQRCSPSPADHIFGTGIGKMIIEGCNPFTRFVVSAKDTAYSSTFGATVFPAVSPNAAVASARDASLWPFASDSMWNRPVGSGAAANLLDHPIIRTDVAGINSTAHSVVVSVYSSSSPSVQITQLTQCGSGAAFAAAPPNQRISAGTTGSDPQSCPRDGFLATIHNDGFTYGFHRFVRQTDTTGTASFHRLGTPGDEHVVSGTGWKSSIGWNGGGHWAGGSTLIGGLMRTWELAEVAAGTRTIFNHVLQATLAATMLKTRTNGQSTTYRWPATFSDGDGTGYSGTVHVGSLLVIPGTFDIEAQSWTAGAKALARTLQRYGCYIVGQGGDGLLFYSEIGANQTPITQMRTNINAIRDQLRVVDNNASDAVGGGGTYPASLWPIGDPYLPF